MRIAICCPYVGRGLGGLERVGIDLCNAMVQKGHNVSLIYYGSNPPLYRVDTSVRLIDQLEVFVDIIEKIDNFCPDVFLGMSSGFKSIYFYKIARVLKVPFCIHESTHFSRFCGPHWAKPRKISFEKAAIERESICAQAVRVRHVLNHSVSSLPDYIQPQLRVFPNPVNFCVSEDERERQVEKTIINVGGLKKVKNIFPLLEAFNSLSSEFSEWKIKVLGSGFAKEKTYQDEISSYLLENDLKEKVVFAGNVSDVKNEYLNAAIHVVGSRDENFCMCLAEALTCGTPSVGFTESFGVSTLIQNEKNGFLVRYDTGSRGIEEVLRKLISQEKLRKSMGDYAFQNSKFSPESLYIEWEQFFNEALTYGGKQEKLLEEQCRIDPERALYAKRTSEQLAEDCVDHE